MRVSYEVPKSAVVSLLMLLIGLFCIGKGSSAFYRYHHALSFSELNGTVCREGRYVAGEIDTCLVKEMNPSGSVKYSGECGVLVAGRRGYHFYTVPISDGRYIQIMAYRQGTRETLQNLVKGEGGAVPFAGILIEPPIELYLKWYEDIPDFRLENLMQDYVLKEIDMKGNKNLIMIGGIVLFCALLLYLQSGGIRKRVLEPERFDKIERFYANSYNKENELEIERGRMCLYRKRKAALKGWCAAGLCGLFLGCGIISITYLYEGRFLGILLILFAIRKIWNCFIHSGLTIAVKIARTFEKRTLHDDIEDCELRIAVLEDFLGKDMITNKEEDLL